ncbi:MAG TPA: hypothetical protein VH140_01885 [Candidatus Acidoferrum sp.]|nr:hypothetical protein [Candidatus Acidoferrum sp.]
MRTFLLGLAVTLALAVGIPTTQAQDKEEEHEHDGREQDGVPRLDHVFVIVLENHNSFTSFGSNGIIGNPQAPKITALWNKYNVATNYNGAWHPSLPNYLAMITGNFIGTDVIGTGHTYPAGSTVGVSDDDSASVSTDYGPAARQPVVSSLARPASVYRGPVAQGRQGLESVPAEPS